MLSYIIRRILLLFPTLLGITLVVFIFMAMSPGKIGANLLDKQGNLPPDQRKAMQDYYEKRYGLNRPWYVQYGKWLNKVSPVGMKPEGGFGFKMPDLGESMIRRRPVLDLMAEAVPITLLLNLVSLPVIYGLSIYAGIRAASRRGGTFDVISGTSLLGLWSFPTILASVLCIGFLASEQYLHWFPTNGLHDLLAGEMTFLPRFADGGFDRGYLIDVLWHLVLPVICLSYGSFAVLTKLSRGAVLDNLAADYVRTARAKGVDEKNVLYRHILRNSLLPLITVSAGILPELLSGSVVVEYVFGIPGMGRLTIESATQKDYELVLSNVLISGFLGLLGNLIADVCYTIADPRVTYDA